MSAFSDSLLCATTLTSEWLLIVTRSKCTVIIAWTHSTLCQGTHSLKCLWKRFCQQLNWQKRLHSESLISHVSNVVWCKTELDYIDFRAVVHCIPYNPVEVSADNTKHAGAGAASEINMFCFVLVCVIFSGRQTWCIRRSLIISMWRSDRSFTGSSIGRWTLASKTLVCL